MRNLPGGYGSDKGVVAAMWTYFPQGLCEGVAAEEGQLPNVRYAITACWISRLVWILTAMQLPQISQFGDVILFETRCEGTVSCRCRLLLDEGLLGGAGDLEDGSSAADSRHQHATVSSTPHNNQTVSNTSQSGLETPAGTSPAVTSHAETRSSR